MNRIIPENISLYSKFKIVELFALLILVLIEAAALIPINFNHFFAIIVAG